MPNIAHIASEEAEEMKSLVAGVGYIKQQNQALSRSEGDKAVTDDGSNESDPINYQCVIHIVLCYS